MVNILGTLHHQVSQCARETSKMCIFGEIGQMLIQPSLKSQSSKIGLIEGRKNMLKNMFRKSYKYED